MLLLACFLSAVDAIESPGGARAAMTWRGPVVDRVDSLQLFMTLHEEMRSDMKELRSDMKELRSELRSDMRLLGVLLGGLTVWLNAHFQAGSKDREEYLANESHDLVPLEVTFRGVVVAVAVFVLITILLHYFVKLLSYL